jgi:hypothetical protein
MGFASGPVTFKRFFVAGAAPKRVDQDLLDRVEQRAIGKGTVSARDGSEAGWVTGDHILDTKFDFAKNAIAECLYLAMRVDANKPPSEIVRSYQRIHEQALLEKSGREFLSRQERREAREAARDQAEKEARAGRFRRMRQVPMLWDLTRNQVYLAATAPAVVDRRRDGLALRRCRQTDRSVRRASPRPVHRPAGGCGDRPRRRPR